MGSMRTRVMDRRTDGAGYIGPPEGYGGSKIAKRVCLLLVCFFDSHASTIAPLPASVPEVPMFTRLDLYQKLVRRMEEENNIYIHDMINFSFDVSKQIKLQLVSCRESLC